MALGARLRSQELGARLRRGKGREEYSGGACKQERKQAWSKNPFLRRWAAQFLGL